MMIHTWYERCSAVRKSLSVVVVWATCAMLLSSIPSPALGGEEIDEKLGAAKEAYEEARSEAKNGVLTKYRELIASVSDKKKKLEEASRIQNEMNLFEKDGIMIPRGEMTQTFIKYGESLKKAADKLSDTYTEAAGTLAKAGELDQAEEVRRELAAFSLPAKIVSLQVLRSKNYVMHGDYKGAAKPATNIGEKMNATFEMVNGLAEPSFVSFRSVNVPNFYLHHGGMRIRMSRFDKAEGYRQNATFKKVSGLASPSAVSFESVNYPGHYLRARGNGELWLDKYDSSNQFEMDASFVISSPLFKFW